MSRVVLATYGSLGDLHPLIAIGRALAGRGHDPVVATSALFRDRIEREGLAFRPLRPDLKPGEDPALYRRVMEHGRGTEVLLREILFPSLRESFDDLGEATRGADLLVGGELLFAGPPLAEAAGIRWASYVLAPFSFFSVHDPPLVGPFPRIARVRRALGPWASRGLFAVLRRITAGWARPVVRLRRELGLPPGAHPLFEGKHSPDLVLAIFSPLLGAPQPDWPRSARVTGFAFHDRPTGEPTLPPEAEEFLAAGSPPVVFTLGSAASRAAGRFFEASLDAARRVGVRAVLVLGPDPPVRPTVPARDALVLDYAPYSALFPRAAAVVHQGGIGTVAQALRAGRPMLVVPFAHDQFDNAARAERLGVARVLARRRYAGARAAAELGRLLEDPACEARSVEAAARIRCENGAEAACDAIGALLGRSSR